MGSVTGIPSFTMRMERNGNGLLTDRASLFCLKTGKELLQRKKKLLRWSKRMEPLYDSYDMELFRTPGQLR